MQKKCLTVFSSHIGTESIGNVTNTFMCVLYGMKWVLMWHNSVIPYVPESQNYWYVKKGDIGERQKKLNKNLTILIINQSRSMNPGDILPLSV